MNRKDILKSIEAGKRFKQMNYPKGKRIELKHGTCDNCMEYVAGENSCSCGDTKMHLEVVNVDDSFKGYLVKN